ncbi:glucoamylase family protein [Martelella sp.]|mgnify:CR=1 FL=1|uniref:GH36-type glycosyl hydrolase domain-containing protein n=2 Tax=unclassified Martelella TaxID=2629616 RepID=UPI0025BEE832|nr:glucoamylase family protein [Martelella sp.]
MKINLKFPGARIASPLWSDRAPVRQELFSTERLEQHAISLAAAQPVSGKAPAVMSLHKRLSGNAAVLLSAYRASIAELKNGREVVPAAEWLLDNYHLVEEQIQEIRNDLPPGYYRQLPKLADGPFAGYPRVLELAWAFVAHTDSLFDRDKLKRFLTAYQQVQPLTIGELWAVAITLRFVLVENLRRLADQITAGDAARAEASALSARLLDPGAEEAAFSANIAARSAAPLPERFAAHLAKQLRNRDPSTTPALAWLEEKLAQQGSSIEEVVQHSQQRQGASNVTIRNIVTSIRLISDIDWTEMFESVSLVDARMRAASHFADMDFPTRDLYRKAIEQLSRGSSLTELDVTGKALDAARLSSSDQSDAIEAARSADPGYHLISEGRPALERAIGFRPPVRLWLGRLNIRLGIGGYVGASLIVTALLMALSLMLLSRTGLETGWLVMFAALAFLPATEVATAIVNRAMSWCFGATILPGLSLRQGVPPTLRTLVAIPTLLTSETDILEQVERLEVHHLSGAGGDLVFALVTDGIDADDEVVEADERLLAVAADAIARLNQHHEPVNGGDRFLLLHRRRLFNAEEGRWMGWERKRGKLHELNRLLRGADDTSFAPVAGSPPKVPADVRYVITLDADTRLPRDAAHRLIGKMAHPLNRPRFSEAERRIVDGYGILQPRVTPSLPVGREGSLYQRVFSAPGGIDPYAAAASNVYQDLFGVGAYTGKGIYDIDAFESALSGRVPDNTMLSHDLFEGAFARAGLASDVEVIEEFPARYDVDARRQHRWTRGDWQLLPWLTGQERNNGSAPAVGRGMMIDNLKRSLAAPLTMLGFGLAWLMPMPAALTATALLVAAMAIPAFLPILFALTPRSGDIHMRSHVAALGADLRLAALRTCLDLAFLPDRAWRMTDAIARTLTRLYRTRRHLLEWTTSAQSQGSPRLDAAGFYRRMAPGTLIGLAIAVSACLLTASSVPLVLPFALLWLLAPAIALWISRPPARGAGPAISDRDAHQLRLIARRTWRFFETFVTPESNMLPPDNFQEDPKPVIARRTSPTNIGLYLLSAVAARDFGWAGKAETVERLEATLKTMTALPKHRGHLFNWYATDDMRVLDPAYVSSVDSGNLAGHLIALANACEMWAEADDVPDIRTGLKDNLALARQAFDAITGSGQQGDGHLTPVLDDIEARLNGSQSFETVAPMLMRLADKAAAIAREMVPKNREAACSDLIFWLDALKKRIAEETRDRLGDNGLELRLTAIASQARAMALAMDFAFLLDPERKLLSIGYSLADNSLDVNCYDLLASEARLASLFAIAKGDVETRHWFLLGRPATPLSGTSALVSWSGSMFEYLMPPLIMRAPEGSLLAQTNRLVVSRQQAYAETLGTPWGISESAYNARDTELTYQYSNFGVPGLGLKRGLSENAVIAPYATGLATMIDPAGACANYTRLAALGALGSYGFYEALDFTRTRLPEKDEVAIVRTSMAHHQGMTIVAIVNTLRDGIMRERFHREPMIRACELLLQERIPRIVANDHKRVGEAPLSPVRSSLGPDTSRRIAESAAGPPVTHLLSNGRYAVMLTANGAGYSRWRGLAITRWHEDATRDGDGSPIFIRDVHTGAVWSAGARPLGRDSENGDVVFDEDRARFLSIQGGLTTTMDVMVSGEDDCEVRRVSISNRSRRAREIEITSYAELVLAPVSADTAHPAFSKMFVQTEYSAEYGALIATRRPRTPDESRIWAAHFAVVEGKIAADPQFETDRARFIGRGRTAATAAAMDTDTPLSNTVGTVLDPVFAIRQRVTIAPGKVARVAFWTVVASTRADLVDLIDRHLDRSAFERARTLAWTQAQVQLRHLDVKSGEAADFQRLAAPIIYADPRYRASGAEIEHGAGPQSGLWHLGISGDFPIVLLSIDDPQDMAQVHQLLRAHEYWRMKSLAVDLVIINARASSYTQDLQIAIEAAHRSSQSRPRPGIELAHGSVFVLRADLMSAEAHAQLHSVARVKLNARRGPIAEQYPDLTALPPSQALPSAPKQAPMANAAPHPRPALEFFNGLGGFDKDGREYVTVLEAGAVTPAPWINVIANSGFGFQVSAEGNGYTWAENSRENQLTPWSNDPVTDPAGETLYIRDEDTGELFSATAQPIRRKGAYIARHGFGYSRFEHEENGIATELLQYVPLADPIKISRLTLSNMTKRPRRLTVTSYAELVLGGARSATAAFLITGIDPETGALFARNPWSAGFPGRVAFVDLGGEQTSWTADRSEFLGRRGNAAAPQALFLDTPLSGAAGAGLDPCAALQRTIVLSPGETMEIVSFLGESGSADEARDLLKRYREADLDAVLKEVTDHWSDLLQTVQVRTPDRAMDIMLNGWLLYQTVACRIRARSAFYQASGAYGFRDQLQDGMALTLARPEETRHHILRAASRQFAEGDVQHWWLPQSGQGVRTRISDDRVWLAFAAATYVKTSGDEAILDVAVPFLEGPPLEPGQHDAFFHPTIAAETATLFEHMARGLDQCIALTGEHGLPLMGTGDWNDGMNRVGEDGRGESVWLGWLLLAAIDLCAPLAEHRDPQRGHRWRAHAETLREAIETHAWDGEWYARATFDDGTWLGASDNHECRIDSIAQSWSVLSGAGDPARAATAMASLEKHLIRRDDGLALLFTPPFDDGPRDPGYIKGYPPGLRENGGQYSHAAMWAIMAFAKSGAGDKAHDLFTLLNPINHAQTPAEADRYKVEPYVVAADVYSVAPHVGRGGWTWYTGSGGWMYRAGIEGILGIRREGGFLIIDPSIPAEWPDFEAVVTVDKTRLSIRVDNAGQPGPGAWNAVLDGNNVAASAGPVRAPIDGADHVLLLG